MNDDLETMSEIIGPTSTRKMVQQFGGQNLYIPKRKTKTVIVHHIKEHFDGKNMMKICSELQISRSTFYRHLKDV